jgi:vacuolar-type H+-ATPase subunit E/Vma4
MAFFKKNVGPAPEELVARQRAKSQAEYYFNSAKLARNERHFEMARSQATEALDIAKSAPGYLAITDQLTDFLASLPAPRRNRHPGRQPLAQAA